MFSTTARFNVNPAGRRSYKTERAKRKLVMGSECWKGALHTPGGKFFYAAPTYNQAKRIAWRDLKDMTGPFWGRDPIESELIITLRNAAEIHVLGMDNPARIEGVMWHGGVLDEYADMKEEAWPAHVQPVTADTGAWVDFIGVPEGRNHYYDLAEYARTSGDVEWGFWTWKSSDVLPASVIESARRTQDERTFRQEYEASFIDSGVIAYYSFSDANIAAYQLDPHQPVFMTWDFNAGEKPMAVVLIQHRDGRYHAFKEFVVSQTNTESMCQIVRDYLVTNQFTGELEVTGDWAGKRRESNASFSDYEIIEQHFKNYRGYRIKNRPTRSVRDRVSSLNAMFCNAAGDRRLFVDPSCTALIEDLRKTSWKDNGVDLDGSNPQRTHATDALSYYTMNYHPTDVKAVTVTASH